MGARKMKPYNQYPFRMLKAYLRRGFRTWGQGDTIVEVMMSMTVLAIVLATTYSLSTRAFQGGLNSQYRDQAINYTQQQLEMIREADNNKPATISTYTAAPYNTSFCIDPNTKVRLTPSATNCVFDKQYTVTYKYDNASKTFTVTTTWQSATSTIQKNVVYYKPNDSFTGGTIACTSASDTCATILTNVPAVGVTATPSGTVDSGTNVTIRWNSTNVAAGSCTPSSTPLNLSFNGVNGNANPGTWSSASIPDGSNIFTITCRDNVGNPVAGQATVNVVHPIINTFSANGVNAPGTVTIPYGTRANVTWSASNVVGCTASGPWSTGGAVSGTNPTNALTATTVIGLTCTSSSGNTVTAPNIIINVGPPPKPDVSMWPSAWSVRNHDVLYLGYSINTYGLPTTCTASSDGDWTGNISPTSTYAGFYVFSYSTAGAYRNYYLTCTNSSGTTTAPVQNVYVGPAGLTGHYYQGANFEYYQSSAIDSTVWFSWDDTYGQNGGWPESLRARANTGSCNFCSVYWSGYIWVDTPGYYYFGAYHDDGMGIYVDGTWVFYNWASAPVTWDQNYIYLGAGWHYIQVNWDNNYGGQEYWMDAIAEWYGPWGYWAQISPNNLSP
jgi:Tfp pilus assembly protein PilV